MPPTPKPEPDWPMPKLNIRVENLSHEGAALFFDHVQPGAALREAVLASFHWLYTLDSVPRNVEQILLVLREMDGVAVTFGSSTHKEIHFSLQHIVNSKARAREEILGVLVHEVVHCYQHDGKGSAPGGLIEGVADYVRLHAKYIPPHWKKSGGDKWDAGYQVTGYFLDWIENRYGDGTVKEINEAMKGEEYHRRIFKDATGRPVRKLWKLYCAHLEEADKLPKEPLQVQDSSDTSPSTPPSEEEDEDAWEEL